jgi:hypothetical protein
VHSRKTRLQVLCGCIMHPQHGVRITRAQQPQHPSVSTFNIFRLSTSWDVLPCKTRLQVQTKSLLALNTPHDHSCSIRCFGKSTSWDVLHSNFRIFVMCHDYVVLRTTFLSNATTRSPHGTLLLTIFCSLQTVMFEAKGDKTKDDSTAAEGSLEVQQERRLLRHLSVNRNTSQGVNGSSSDIQNSSGKSIYVFVRMLKMSNTPQGDSRVSDFVTRCMTSESGVRVKAQLILCDPPGRHRL